MNMIGSNNLGINGRGKVSGGTFNRVNIHGDGRVEGNLTCARLLTSGRCGINGDVETQLIEINGDATFLGNVAGILGQFHGRTKVLGNLNLKEMEMNGQGKIKGNWEAERVKVLGSLSVGGTFTGDQVLIRGGCHFRSPICVNHLELRLHANSSAKTIEGEFIHVKRVFGFLWLLQNLFFQSLSLTAQSIEGKVVILENTRAKMVRGDRVMIGPRCEIEHVEYRSHFHQHTGAVVHHRKQIG